MLFLIDLIDNCLSKNNNSSNVLVDYSLWISEMNDSNVIRDKRGNWEFSVIRYLSYLWSSINRLTLVVKKYNQWAKRKWNNIKCSVKNGEGRMGGSRAVWGHFTSCVQGGFLRSHPYSLLIAWLPPLWVSRRPLEGSVPVGLPCTAVIPPGWSWHLMTWRSRSTNWHERPAAEWSWDAHMDGIVPWQAIKSWEFLSSKDFLLIFLRISSIELRNLLLFESTFRE